MIESYSTIGQELKKMITRKKSKFICILKPVQSEDEVEEFIRAIKKEYYDARHHCVASVVGIDQRIERANDDGEPSGTAGRPMLEVLKGRGLRNVCAIVVRYFGGTKLGTGGLIKAYTESVQETLLDCEILKYKLCENLLVKVEYGLLAKVEYEIRKRNQQIVKMDYSEHVDIFVMVDIKEVNSVMDCLVEITSGGVTVIKKGKEYILDNI